MGDLAGAVCRFRGTQVRAWYLWETEPGVWRGVRVHGAGDVIERTITGPEWQVAGAIGDYRQGLPIVRLPLGSGGAA